MTSPARQSRREKLRTVVAGVAAHVEARSAANGAEPVAEVLQPEPVAVEPLEPATDPSPGADDDRPGAWAGVRLSWSAAKSEVAVYGERLGVDSEAGFWVGLRQLGAELAEDAGLNRQALLASLCRVLVASGHPWAVRVANSLPLLAMFLANRERRK